MTYLTIPICAENPDGASRQIKEAVSAGAEMLELRTDYLVRLDVETVAALVTQAKRAIPASLPVIVTCRDPREGGAGNHPPSLRTEVLLAALGAGADFIDLEYANFIQPETRAQDHIGPRRPSPEPADPVGARLPGQIPGHAAALP